MTKFPSWKRGKAVSEKDIRIPVTRGDENQEGNVENESMRVDADVAKLTTDLEDLRQTLLRRQADFDNYKKRIERERAEDFKRTTARLIEARSEEHTSELQSHLNLVCRLLLEKKNKV